MPSVELLPSRGYQLEGPWRCQRLRMKREQGCLKHSDIPLEWTVLQMQSADGEEAKILPRVISCASRLGFHHVKGSGLAPPSCGAVWDPAS